MTAPLIPADYWEGTRTLELEIPWYTPEAIVSLDLYCKPHHRVLEFGGGGSTLFMARRCREVLCIESLPQWEENIRNACRDKGLQNKVEVRHGMTIQDFQYIVGKRRFDIALIDCVNIDRRDALAFALTVTGPGLVVIDNHDATYCAGINLLLESYPKQTNYDDCHWVGGGTRVVYV